MLFSVLIKPSATTDFSSFYVEYILMLFILKNFLKSLLWNSPPWSIHILFGSLPFETIFRNALTILIALLSFKRITHGYLLNKSIADNKYLIPLLLLLSDCISAKRWINFSFLKFSINLLVKFICKLIIWFSSSKTTSTKLFTKKPVNHWC